LRHSQEATQQRNPGLAVHVLLLLLLLLLLFALAAAAAASPREPTF
jgi:Tfp pilus assembly protein PilX